MDTPLFFVVATPLLGRGTDLRTCKGRADTGRRWRVSTCLSYATISAVGNIDGGNVGSGGSGGIVDGLQVEVNKGVVGDVGDGFVDGFVDDVDDEEGNSGVNGIVDEVVDELGDEDVDEDAVDDVDEDAVDDVDEDAVGDVDEDVDEDVVDDVFDGVVDNSPPPSAIVPDEEDDQVDAPPALSLVDDDVDDIPSYRNSGPEAGLDTYVDTDDGDGDERLASTSASTFGRVWEVNDDSYITRTGKGESFVYELDEEEGEDQEMMTVRRGKDGGWQGGLMGGSRDLIRGSGEWKGRQMYEVMKSADYRDMFRWTRRGGKPPAGIDDIWGPGQEVLGIEGKAELKGRVEIAETPIRGLDSSGTIKDRGTTPLERSMRFPCRFKFKVEGLENGFVESVKETVRQVLGKDVAEDDLTVEDAEGKLIRVVVVVEVESALQVTEVFEALRANEKVKYSYG